jgi:hypothetical protein
LEFFWTIGLLALLSAFAWLSFKTARLGGPRFVLAVLVCLAYAGIGIGGFTYFLSNAETGDAVVQALLAFGAYFVLGLYPVVRICKAIDW